MNTAYIKESGIKNLMRSNLNINNETKQVTSKHKYTVHFKVREERKVVSEISENAGLYFNKEPAYKEDIQTYTHTLYVCMYVYEGQRWVDQY